MAEKWLDLMFSAPPRQTGVGLIGLLFPICGGSFREHLYVVSEYRDPEQSRVTCDTPALDRTSLEQPPCALLSDIQIANFLSCNRTHRIHRYSVAKTYNRKSVFKSQSRKSG
jgi:catabolite regulation protein CreA